MTMSLPSDKKMTFSQSNPQVATQGWNLRSTTALFGSGVEAGEVTADYGRGVCVCVWSTAHIAGCKPTAGSRPVKRR